MRAAYERELRAGLRATLAALPLAAHRLIVRPDGMRFEIDPAGGTPTHFDYVGNVEARPVDRMVLKLFRSAEVELRRQGLIR